MYTTRNIGAFSSDFNMLEGHGFDPSVANSMGDDKTSESEEGIIENLPVKIVNRKSTNRIRKLVSGYSLGCSTYDVTRAAGQNTVLSAEEK